MEEYPDLNRPTIQEVFLLGAALSQHSVLYSRSEKLQETPTGIREGASAVPYGAPSDYVSIADATSKLWVTSGFQAEALASLTSPLENGAGPPPSARAEDGHNAEGLVCDTCGVTATHFPVDTWEPLQSSFLSARSLYRQKVSQPRVARDREFEDIVGSVLRGVEGKLENKGRGSEWESFQWEEEESVCVSSSFASLSALMFSGFDTILERAKSSTAVGSVLLPAVTIAVEGMLAAARLQLSVVSEPNAMCRALCRRFRLSLELATAHEGTDALALSSLAVEGMLFVGLTLLAGASEVSSPLRVSFTTETAWMLGFRFLLNTVRLLLMTPSLQAQGTVELHNETVDMLQGFVQCVHSQQTTPTQEGCIIPTLVSAAASMSATPVPSPLRFPVGAAGGPPVCQSLFYRSPADHHTAVNQRHTVLASCAQGRSMYMLYAVMSQQPKQVALARFSLSSSAPAVELNPAAWRFSESCVNVRSDGNWKLMDVLDGSDVNPTTSTWSMVALPDGPASSPLSSPLLASAPQAFLILRQRSLEGVIISTHLQYCNINGDVVDVLCAEPACTSTNFLPPNIPPHLTELLRDISRYFCDSIVLPGTESIDALQARLTSHGGEIGVVSVSHSFDFRMKLFHAATPALNTEVSVPLELPLECVVKLQHAVYDGVSLEATIQCVLPGSTAPLSLSLLPASPAASLTLQPYEGQSALAASSICKSKYGYFCMAFSPAFAHHALNISFIPSPLSSSPGAMRSQLLARTCPSQPSGAFHCLLDELCAGLMMSLSGFNRWSSTTALQHAFLGILHCCRSLETLKQPLVDDLCNSCVINSLNNVLSRTNRGHESAVLADTLLSPTVRHSQADMKPSSMLFPSIRSKIDVLVGKPSSHAQWEDVLPLFEKSCTGWSADYLLSCMNTQEVGRLLQRLCEDGGFHTAAVEQLVLALISGEGDESKGFSTSLSMFRALPPLRATLETMLVQLPHQYQRVDGASGGIDSCAASLLLLLCTLNDSDMETCMAAGTDALCDVVQEALALARLTSTPIHHVTPRRWTALHKASTSLCFRVTTMLLQCVPLQPTPQPASTDMEHKWLADVPTAPTRISLRLDESDVLTGSFLQVQPEVTLLSRAPSGGDRTPPRLARESPGKSPVGSPGETTPGGGGLRMLALANATKSPARLPEGSPNRLFPPRSPLESPSSPLMSTLSPLRGPVDFPPLRDTPGFTGFSLDAAAAHTPSPLLGALKARQDSDDFDSFSITPPADASASVTSSPPKHGSSAGTPSTVLSLLDSPSKVARYGLYEGSPSKHDDSPVGLASLGGEEEGEAQAAAAPVLAMATIPDTAEKIVWEADLLFRGSVQAGLRALAASSIEGHGAPVSERLRSFLHAFGGRHSRRNPEPADSIPMRTIRVNDDEVDDARVICPSVWAFRLQEKARGAAPRVHRDIAWDIPTVNRAERMVAAALLWHTAPTAGSDAWLHYLSCAVPDAKGVDAKAEYASDAFKIARKVRKWLTDTRRLITSDRRLYEKLAPGIEKRATFLLRLTPTWALTPTWSATQQASIEKSIMVFVTSHKVSAVDHVDLCAAVQQRIASLSPFTKVTHTAIQSARELITMTPGFTMSTYATELMMSMSSVVKCTSEADEALEPWMKTLRHFVASVASTCLQACTSTDQLRKMILAMPLHDIVDPRSMSATLREQLMELYLSAWQHTHACNTPPTGTVTTPTVGTTRQSSTVDITQDCTFATNSAALKSKKLLRVPKQRPLDGTTTVGQRRMAQRELAEALAGFEVELEHLRAGRNNHAPVIPTIELNVPKEFQRARLHLQIWAGDFPQVAAKDILVCVSPVDAEGEEQSTVAWPWPIVHPSDGEEFDNGCMPVPTTYGGVDLTPLRVSAPVAVGAPSQVASTACGSAWSFPTRLRIAHDNTWLQIFCSDACSDEPLQGANSAAMRPVNFGASWPIARIRISYLSAQDGGARLRVGPLRLFAEVTRQPKTSVLALQSAAVAISAASLLGSLQAAPASTVEVVNGALNKLNDSTFVPLSRMIRDAVAHVALSGDVTAFHALLECLQHHVSTGSRTCKLVSAACLLDCTKAHTAAVQASAWGCVAAAVLKNALVHDEELASCSVRLLAWLFPKVRGEERTAMLSTLADSTSTLCDFARCFVQEAGTSPSALVHDEHRVQLRSEGNRVVSVTVTDASIHIHHQPVEAPLVPCLSTITNLPITDDVVVLRAVAHALQTQIKACLSTGADTEALLACFHRFPKAVHTLLMREVPSGLTTLVEAAARIRSNPTESELVSLKAARATSFMVAINAETASIEVRGAVLKMSAPCTIISGQLTATSVEKPLAASIYCPFSTTPAAIQATARDCVPCFDMRPFFKSMSLCGRDDSGSLMLDAMRALLQACASGSHASVILLDVDPVTASVASEGLPLTVCCVDEKFAAALRWKCIDLKAWAAGLVRGSLVDAKMPLTGLWAPSLVVVRASQPFDHWVRVDFGMATEERIRYWIPWEHGFNHSLSSTSSSSSAMTQHTRGCALPPPVYAVWGETAILPAGWVSGPGCSSTIMPFPRLETGLSDHLIIEAGNYVADARGPWIAAQAAVALKAFRSGLKVGDDVDAMDCHHKWYEARVVEASDEDVRVRFLGWCPRSQPDKYDEWVARNSDRVLPKGCKIRNWRRAQVGDEVEVRDDRTVDTNKITAVDVARKLVRVGGSAAWISVDDIYTIACHSTHRRPREWSDVDWEGGTEDGIPSLALWNEAWAGLCRQVLTLGDGLAGMEGGAEGQRQTADEAGGDVAVEGEERGGEGRGEATATDPLASLDEPHRLTAVLPLLQVASGNSTARGAVLVLPSASAELCLTSWVRIMEQPAERTILLFQNPLVDLPKVLTPGYLVEARYGSLTWYTARIEASNGDNSYAVSYEDGDRSPALARSRLRLRSDARQALQLSVDTDGYLLLAIVCFPAPDTLEGVSISDPLETYVSESWASSASMRSQEVVAARKMLSAEPLLVASVKSSVPLRVGALHHVTIRTAAGLVCLDIDGVSQGTSVAEIYPRSPIVYVGESNRVAPRVASKSRPFAIVYSHDAITMGTSASDAIIKAWAAPTVGAQFQDLRVSHQWASMDEIVDEISEAVDFALPTQTSQLVSMLQQGCDDMGLLREHYSYDAESKESEEDALMMSPVAAVFGLPPILPPHCLDRLLTHRVETGLSNKMLVNMLHDDCIADGMAARARPAQQDARLLGFYIDAAARVDGNTLSPTAQIAPLDVTHGSNLLAVGSLVYTDAYDLRLPALITQTLERHKRYAVRFLPVAQAGALGGSTITAETHNMYICANPHAPAREVSFVPIMHHYQSLRKRDAAQAGGEEVPLPSHTSVATDIALQAAWRACDASLCTSGLSSSVLTFFSSSPLSSCCTWWTPACMARAMLAYDDAGQKSSVAWLVSTLSAWSHRLTHCQVFCLSVLSSLLDAIRAKEVHTNSPIRIALISADVLTALFRMLTCERALLHVPVCACLLPSPLPSSLPASLPSEVTRAVILIVELMNAAGLTASVFNKPVQPHGCSLKTLFRSLVASLRHASGDADQASMHWANNYDIQDVRTLFLRSRDAVPVGSHDGTVLTCAVVHVGDLTAVLLPQLPRLAAEGLYVTNPGLPKRVCPSRVVLLLDRAISAASAMEDCCALGSVQPYHHMLPSMLPRKLQKLQQNINYISEFPVATVAAIAGDLSHWASRAPSASRFRGHLELPDELQHLEEWAHALQSSFPWIDLQERLAAGSEMIEARPHESSGHQYLRLLARIMMVHECVYETLPLLPILSPHMRKWLRIVLLGPFKSAVVSAFMKATRNQKMAENSDDIARCSFARFAPTCDCMESDVDFSEDCSIPFAMLPTSSLLSLQKDVKSHLQPTGLCCLIEEGIFDLTACPSCSLDPAITCPCMVIPSGEDLSSGSDSDALPGLIQSIATDHQLEPAWQLDDASEGGEAVGEPQSESAMDLTEQDFFTPGMTDSPQGSEARALRLTSIFSSQSPRLEPSMRLAFAQFPRSVRSAELSAGDFHMALMEQFDMLLGLLEGRGISQVNIADALEVNGPLMRVRINRWQGKQEGNTAATLIFEQMFQQVYCSSVALPHALRQSGRPWRVELLGEGGLDAGGLFAEALTSAFEELMENKPEQPDTGLHMPLFVPSPNARGKVGSDQDTVLPNPWMHEGTHSCPYPAMLAAAHRYVFVGRLMGVALRVGFQLPLRFPPLVWKAIVSDAPDATVADILAFDDTLGKQLQRVVTAVHSNDASALEGLLFTITSLIPGREPIPLAPPAGASTAHVTLASATSFIDQAIAARLDAVRLPCRLIGLGLGAVVPLEPLQLLTPSELEVMVCGNPGIDITLLKRHTRYEGYADTSPVVARFWNMMASLTSAQQEEVLRFIYARRRLPATDHGFTQAFTISRMARDDPDSTLPQAHSCTFQLDLPEHSSEEVMKRQLLRACELCTCYDLDGGASGLA